MLGHLDIAQIAAARFVQKRRMALYIFDELLSSAYLGLCHAAQKFDELRKSERSGLPVNFRSYSLTVCSHQLLADRNDDLLIHVPMHNFKPLQKGRKKRHTLEDAKRAMRIDRYPLEELDSMEWQ